ncbi:MAG: hypothetical protein ACYCZH_09720 [Sulfuriferula sp.]
MAAVNSTFSERLNEAFTFCDITTTPEKIDRLTAATGRTPRTVKRWLSGASMPSSPSARGRIAKDLNIDIVWLYNGHGMPPLNYKLSRIPKELMPKFMRYLIRLMNNDPKAMRWIAMSARGELGIEQILAMA